jgi:GT2 family glycosyltransferase
MEVAVVILNYNGEKFLKQFLPNVIEYSKDATIYLADNCSTDNSVNYLKQNFPEVKLIINAENGGFAKGYNDALKNVKADYYVLLNSDIEVTPNWIEPCIDLLEKDKLIAALQPKILAYHDKTKFEHAGAAGGYLDKDFYPFCQGRIFDEVEKDSAQYNESKEIFWASGACLFIRANLYHEFEGLDSSFFAHMEEIDLCWRMKQQNHKIFYCADSTVYHVGGGTLNYNSPKKTFLNFRNSLYMITKNYEGILLFKILKRLFLDGLAGVMFISKLQFKHFGAVLNAHFTYYANLGQLLSKRKKNKKSRTNFNRKGLYKKSIIFKKYFGGIRFYDQLSAKDFY